ncbi:hypothetical protein [Microbacterium hominis]|uniref:Uncharacterized protein n=1 Tax=Microbacterium hominis TaxID=162426 RepID=A0A7D4TGS7_9MICO|nr:hypothetical protein [Microbacterium hominis]QKJ20400.1 hypothetical protein HQM25_14195 [Microbacterium hominis]
MIGVRTDLDEYRAAVAELPATAALSDAADSIAVVRGAAGWARTVLHAVASGARAVVVDAPDSASGDLDALAGCAAPIVFSRRGLRADAAADAASSGRPAAVTVQLQAPRGGLRAALVDAVGWARVIAGADLAMHAAAGDDRSALVDLAYDGGGAVLIGSERLDARGILRLRATSVAPERVDVVTDGIAATVTRATPAGELVLPRRWEAPARLALRRAVAALEEGAAIDDLSQWRHDAALAERARAASSAELYQ